MMKKLAIVSLLLPLLAFAQAREVTGKRVAFECPSGTVGVSLHWKDDPSQAMRTYIQDPGYITKCVPHEMTPEPRPGTTVAMSAESGALKIVRVVDRKKKQAPAAP